MEQGWSLLVCRVQEEGHPTASDQDSCPQSQGYVDRLRQESSPVWRDAIGSLAGRCSHHPSSKPVDQS